jgi:hypothetical protein
MCSTPRLHLGVEVVHVRDGAEALDYLHRRGPFAGRADDDMIDDQGRADPYLTSLQKPVETVTMRP